MVKFCPQCGTPPIQGAKFCMECGFKFSAIADAQRTPAAVPPPVHVHTPMPKLEEELRPLGSPVLEESAPSVPASPSAPASNQTLIVSMQGDGDFPTITEALRSAEPGARLLVQRGLYTEQVVIEKPVQLVRESNDGDVVIASCNEPALCVQADAVMVKGLTLMTRRDSSTIPDAVAISTVHVQAGQGIVFEDCTLEIKTDAPEAEESALGHYNHCVEVDAEATPCFRRCTMSGGASTVSLPAEQYHEDMEPNGERKKTVVLEDCDLSNFAVAGVDSGPFLIMRRCNIHNGRGDGKGITITSNRKKGVRPGEMVLIEDCELHRCGKHGLELLSIYWGGSFISEDARTFTLRRCNVSGVSEDGIRAEGGTLVLEECVITESGTTQDGIRSDGGVWKAGGKLVLKGCRISGNGFGVKVSQGDQFTNLGANAKFVEVIAEDCNLMDNVLGSWSVPETATVMKHNVRDNMNNSLRAKLYRRVNNL